MKFSLKRSLSMLLAVAMVFVFSAMSVFAAAGGTLTGEDVTVDVGTATVDVKITFSTEGVELFENLSFKAIPDAGLTLTSVTLPAEYTQYSDLKNDTTIAENLVWFSNANFAFDYAAAPTANIVLTYTIADPSVAKTYNIAIEDPVASFDWMENTNISVAKNASVTVQAAAPAVSVEWKTATEAIEGAVRFLFDAAVTGGDVTESGIKFVNAKNFDANAVGVAGTATTFYGDLTDIPAETDYTAYYAAGYVKINGEYKWEIVDLGGNK